MFARERIRWGLALLAFMFAALTAASIAERQDLATIASSGIAAAILGGAWYFVGWLQFRR